MMRIFPRARPREQRTVRNGVQVIRDKSTQQEREVCHGTAWEERRREVWDRDDGRCTDCGTPVPLHNEFNGRGYLIRRAAEIHHRSNRKMGGSHRDDRMDNLATLCSDCHRRRTAQGE